MANELYSTEQRPQFFKVHEQASVRDRQLPKDILPGYIREPGQGIVQTDFPIAPQNVFASGPGFRQMIAKAVQNPEELSDNERVMVQKAIDLEIIPDVFKQGAQAKISKVLEPLDLMFEEQAQVVAENSHRVFADEAAGYLNILGQQLQRFATNPPMKDLNLPDRVEQGFRDLGLQPIPKGATHTQYDPKTKEFKDVEYTNAQRITENLMRGAIRLTPELWAAAIDSPYEFIQGLIKFPFEQTGVLLKSFNTKFTATGPEVGQYTSKEVEEAAEEIRQNPIGVLLLGLMGIGVAGRVAKGQLPKVEAPAAAKKPAEVAKGEPVETGKVKLPEMTAEEARILKPVEEKPKVVKDALPEVKKEAVKEGAEKVEAEPVTVKLPEMTVEEAAKLKPIEGEAVGLKKTEIDRIREVLPDIEKLESPKRKSFERSMAEAKEAKLDVNALETARAITESERPTTAAEHAGMVSRAVDLAKEYNERLKTHSELMEKGDVAGAQLERGFITALTKDLDVLTAASERFGGTETARALSIRRMMRKIEDNSPAGVVRRGKVFKGKPLTETETTRLEGAGQKYETARKQLEEVESKLADSEAAREKLVAEGIATHEVRRSRIRKKAEKQHEFIMLERAEIKKGLEKLGYRVNDVTGVTAEGAYWVGRLAVSYIREGVLTLDGVVKKVLADVPDLTATDVYKSLANKEGRRQAKARSNVTERIRQMKRQADLFVRVENAAKGIFEPAKKKAAQPEEIKALQRQLSDLKKEAGRPEKKRQKIEDLENKIKDAEKGVFEPTKKRLPIPAEIRELQRQLTKLRTEAYRSQMETTQLEKAIQTINELQDHLDNHTRSLKKEKRPDTAELAAAKEKMRELRKTMRVEDEIARLNEQHRTGEYEVRERPKPREVPPELERQQVELERARKRNRDEIEKLAPVTTKRVAAEITGALRTAKATADLSGTLRQGLFLITSRPGAAPKAFAQSLAATFSEFKAEAIDMAIRSHPNHYLRERAGVEFTELGGKLTAREEMISSNIMEKIPGYGRIVKGSQRHMTTFLNLMRASVFDGYLDLYPNATRAELKAWANSVNVFSGRGTIGRYGDLAQWVAFAPRFAISRPETPWLIKRHWSEPRVRKELAKTYARTAILGGSLLAMAKLAGFDVGISPRDPDFGKIVVGKTRIDIWAGVQQPVRLVARIGAAVFDRVGVTGEDMADSEKQLDPVELVSRFAAFKLAPWITIGRELLTEKSAVGEPRTPTETAIRSVVPLVYEDILDAYKLEGKERAAVVGGLVTLGVGVSTYEDSKTAVRRDIAALIRVGNYSEARIKALEWNLKHKDQAIRKVSGYDVSKRKPKPKKF